MINIQHIIEFCKSMRSSYNACFRESKIQRGVKIAGEYYSYSGRLFSIMFNVYQNKVETRIYDSSKRLVFSDRYADNINTNARLIQFIQGSVADC